MLARFDHLPAYALFAAVLAAAGLPIYIHAPKFYVDSYGVSLAALGAVLFGLRLIDVVQDPLLGWLSARLGVRRRMAIAVGVLIMALSMIALFAVPPPVSPLLWFGLAMTGLFSGFSFLSITFYARGVAKAQEIGGHGHLRLAAWRETGGLIGVSLAAVTPALLLGVSSPMTVFAAGFALVALLAGASMRGEWSVTATVTETAGAKSGAKSRATSRATSGFKPIVNDPVARRLLLIALANAAPVATSSTLFLFFVESRLEAPNASGVLLLSFFVAAAIAAPVWARLAERHGARPVLLFAMCLSIAAFSFALILGAGDALFFALICLISGAALGADMTLLPAIFAARLARIAPAAAEGFGLWSFVSKLTLAFAAATVLPMLEWSGFQAGAENDAGALRMLSFLYAGLPCLLKLIALALLATTDLKEDMP